jgi:hypothetical protein
MVAVLREGHPEIMPFGTSGAFCATCFVGFTGGTSANMSGSSHHGEKGEDTDQTTGTAAATTAFACRRRASRTALGFERTGPDELWTEDREHAAGGSAATALVGSVAATAAATTV